MSKDYETVTAGDIEVGDFLRRKVWNIQTQSAEFTYLRVESIKDGAISRNIRLVMPDGITRRHHERICPKRTTKVQRKLASCRMSLEEIGAGLRADAAA